MRHRIVLSSVSLAVVGLSLSITYPRWFAALFSSEGFLTHAYCYLGQPLLVALHVSSDALIGLAYVAISGTLTYLVYRGREDIPFSWMFLAFGLFIVACGITHFLEIWTTVVSPVYWLAGHAKLLTAVASVTTAAVLPPVVPKVLAMIRAARVSEERRSQLEAANRELAALYQKVMLLDEVKTQFFANVSHELRTPLTLIQGPTKALMESPSLAEAEREAVDVISRNARILLKHVNDLLDVAKLEAGRMAVRYTNINLGHLVRLTAGYFDGLAQSRRITWTVEAPDLVPAQADTEKIQRVLMNLFSNAFKFTPKEGTIRCVLGSNGDRASIAVSDSGPGVPPALRDAIFERFRQGDGGSARRFGGTGLGLAIAKDFVELHGGTIMVGDAPEGGALFRIDLPLLAPQGATVESADTVDWERITQDAAVEPPAPSPAPVDPSAIPSSNRPVVLVVEDNSDMNRFLVNALSGRYETVSAFDGRQGLEQALACRPDLVLTDIMMPGMSGDAMVEELRKQRAFDDVPIIVLSAKADDDLRVSMLGKGAHDYLMKPFSVEELRARVGNLIAIRQARQQLSQQAAALREANSELEAFSYSVSHDLKAPLRTIDGFGQMLVDAYQDCLDQVGKDYICRIRAATLRMENVINDLLALAQVAKGKLSPRRVDLSGLAAAVLDDLRRNDPGRPAEVTIRGDIAVDADQGLVRLLLENLLSNAWKFTARESIARIEFGERTEAGERVFFVADNGVGFDMADAGQLFKPFQRVHLTEEFKGTGVGLATCERIVRRHGGRIWVETSPGRGATFSFTLASAGAGNGYDSRPPALARALLA